MHRSVKYLLQPTNRQRAKLDHLLWMQRNLYNAALEERKMSWETDARPLTRYEQFAGLNGMAESNPDLGQYGVCVARGTLDATRPGLQGLLPPVQGRGDTRPPPLQGKVPVGLGVVARHPRLEARR